MNARGMKAGLTAVALGVSALVSGLVVDATSAAASVGSPAPSPSSSSPSATPSSASSTCPPAPAGSVDKSDHGFLRVAPVSGTSSGDPIVTQPFTLELICYDTMVQTASVSFRGVAASGATVSVPVVEGPSSFVFTGHKSPNVVDASQTYRLDLTSLGAPGADGWHLLVRVVVAEDNSAVRVLHFVIAPPVTPTPTPTPSQVVTPTPTPSVAPTETTTLAPAPAPTKAVRVATLPFTGTRSTVPLTALGAGLLVIGGLLVTVGRRRRA